MVYHETLAALTGTFFLTCLSNLNVSELPKEMGESAANPLSCLFYKGKTPFFWKHKLL